MLTIGQRLRQAREAKRLTLENVFEGTRIRIAYLQALEADDLSAMPSPVQARGYLRNYAEFLGLDFDQLLEDMRTRAQDAASVEMITPMDESPSPAAQTPAPVPPQEAAPLTKPGPLRRKKADSQPLAADSASLETAAAPKRRGRKKIDPVQEESQPVPVEEPVAAVEPVDTAEIETPPLEQASQQYVDETLWQGQEVVGWGERLRRVLAQRGDGARWHALSRLVVR